MRVNVPSHNTYVNFPDGTPHETIDSVLREKFGAKTEDMAEMPIGLPNSPVVESEPKVEAKIPEPPIRDVQDLTDEELMNIVRGKE